MPTRPDHSQPVIGGTPAAPITPPRAAEEELESLLSEFQQRQTEAKSGPAIQQDPIEAFRERTLRELIPMFVELADKYAKSGAALNMDASNFLQGGREIKFSFALGEYRIQLEGIVTSDSIAFREIRDTPEVRGELASGPMLRLRRLTAQGFRDFICDQLAILIRAAMRRR